MTKNVYKKAVIVFLHNNFDSYLLQLRDFKSSIIYPGHWGAFGGEVEGGESPEIAVGRELIEEIGYSPKSFSFFREVCIDDHELNLHIFYCNMNVSLAKLNLMEGVEMGLFSVEQILSKNLYSKKLGKVFPIVPPLLGFFDEFFENVKKKYQSPLTVASKKEL